MMEKNNNPEASGNMRPFRVLVVDDDDISLKMVFHSLKQLGLKSENFRKAKSGPEAISIFHEDRNFDLIITDFNMENKKGDFNGDELIKRLRNDEYRGIIIGMSGDEPGKVSGNDASVRMLETGANAFIVKKQINSGIEKLIRDFFPDNSRIGEVKPSGGHSDSAQEQQRQAIPPAAGLGVKIASPVINGKLLGDNAKTPIATFQGSFSRDRAATELIYPADLTGSTSSIIKTPSGSKLSDGSRRTQESIAEARKVAEMLVGEVIGSSVQRLQADRINHRKHLPPIPTDSSQQINGGPLAERILLERSSGDEKDPFRS